VKRADQQLDSVEATSAFKNEKLRGPLTCTFSEAVVIVTSPRNEVLVPSGKQQSTGLGHSGRHTVGDDGQRAQIPFASHWKSHILLVIIGMRWEQQPIDPPWNTLRRMHVFEYETCDAW
jgi:hypothetical protein